MEEIGMCYNLWLRQWSMVDQHCHRIRERLLGSELWLTIRAVNAHLRWESVSSLIGRAAAH